MLSLIIYTLDLFNFVPILKRGWICQINQVADKGKTNAFLFVCFCFAAVVCLFSPHVKTLSNFLSDGKIVC